MNLVFSWAQNEQGQLVHINDVANGKQCKCVCPCCKEELIARHGAVRQHGFAHLSDTRQANLKMCYKVILYKLAEQLIATKKQIFAPSYYGIYKECIINFDNIEIDNRYERSDKQPDVIATTKENQQYLIEFILDDIVQHNKDIFYHNLSCLEIDLSNQTLESLENFLFSSSENRRWINNEIYFNGIEEKYQKANKPIKLKNEEDCTLCKVKHSCCAVKDKCGYPILINNNGNIYRLCKTNDFNDLIEKEQNKHIIQDCARTNNLENNLISNQNTIHQKGHNADKPLEIYNQKRYQFSHHKRVFNPDEKSCFNCQNNLNWANKNGYANCGICHTLGIPQKIDPSYAKNCFSYNPKEF